MASKISISKSQAIIAGLGIVALTSGVVIAIATSRKKKKQLNSANRINKNNRDKKK